MTTISQPLDSFHSPPPSLSHWRSAAARAIPHSSALNDPAPAAARPLAIRFDNEARQYVHVYLVGQNREWLLGRVEPGAHATLRIPDEAMADDRWSMRLAVLAGDRVTMRVAPQPACVGHDRAADGAAGRAEVDVHAADDERSGDGAADGAGCGPSRTATEVLRTEYCEYRDLGLARRMHGGPVAGIDTAYSVLEYRLGSSVRSSADHAFVGLVCQSRY